MHNNNKILILTIGEGELPDKLWNIENITDKFEDYCDELTEKLSKLKLQVISNIEWGDWSHAVWLPLYKKFLSIILKIL